MERFKRQGNKHLFQSCPQTQAVSQEVLDLRPFTHVYQKTQDAHRWNKLVQYKQGNKIDAKANVVPDTWLEKSPDSLARINVLELGDIKHIFWGLEMSKK